MPFSMMSYFLGVGTVVGALALGFGGGIVLTKTAIKDTPAGPSRMERVARSETVPAAQVTEAKAIPVPRVDQPAVPAVQAAPQVQAAAEDPKPVTPKENPATVAEPVKQVDAPKQVEQPVRQADVKEVERPVRHSETKPVEQNESAARAAEREQRRAEKRRVEREKRLAERERERKARTIIVQRQRPVEEREQPARAQLAFEREESRPNLFEGLFGRPAQGEPE